MLDQQQCWELRALINKAGWYDFMSHVAGIMAEQSDKFPDGSSEELALTNLNRTLCSLQKFFKECGNLDYKNHPLTPDEYKKFF